MEQSKPIRLADMKDVPTKKSEEVFASDMVQKLRRRLVVMKDVPTMQGEEEEDYAVGMVPKGRITSADMKDAQILLSKEEFVSDMVQNLRSAQVKRYTCRHEGCTNIVREEFVSDMVLKFSKPNSCTYEGCNLLLFDTKYS